MTESNLQGRVALVTGANTGIGRVTAIELARRGAHVVIACRSEPKAQGVVEDIRRTGGQVDVLSLDLADFASIRRCAEAFLARGLPLHLLVNNAGLAGASGLTAQGFELTFGVNHLGTFLFTQLLRERLQASAPARIVTVASRAHMRTKGIPWDGLRAKAATVTGYPEYAVSKLANVLFSAELGRRLAGTGVHTYALHPGVVATDVWRSVPWPLGALLKRFMISPEEGARTTLHCATSNEVATHSGLYYDRCRVKTPSAVAQDVALAQELWQRSEEWVRQG